MAVVRWKRDYSGRNAGRVFVRADRVLVSYVDDQGQPGSPGPTALVCLDLDGRERWRARETGLAAALPDGRVLGVSAYRLRHLDLDGHELGGVRDEGRAVDCGEVTSISREDDRILLQNRSELIVTDMDLNLLQRMPLPEGAAHRAVLAGTALVWVKSGSLMTPDSAGRTRELCRIPIELAEDAMTRWEEETGIPALGGMVRTKLDDPSKLVDAIKSLSKGTPVGIGERVGVYMWSLAVDREAGVLLLSNTTPPHVIVCLA